MVYYVCKYTPVELFAGFGAETAVLDGMYESCEIGESAAHANLCGFGKSVMQAALTGGADELVLVNCCDVMRRVYDVLLKKGCCRFLFLLDLPHTDSECQRVRYAKELERLKAAYAAYSGREFDQELFKKSFKKPEILPGPYVAILGARAGKATEDMARAACGRVRNLTCVGNRDVPMPTYGGDIMLSYAAALLGQLPCRRMADSSPRRALFADPGLRGVIYHTIKFCDYYGLEYADARAHSNVPIVKVETDYTLQSSGQLRTRLEAFGETLGGIPEPRQAPADGGEYFAGVDSGSASTDAVITDADGNIVASCVLPTGGGARQSADAALGEVLKKSGLSRGQIARVVATGYGRANIGGDNENITEISCHAKGAHRLLPEARTVIDIGGQDSKVIRLAPDGKVLNFAMNDKCAAGTGRFLEMMARTLGMSMEDMSAAGLRWHEDITISSMCTVFAESEVVTLVAQNREVGDIVHGLNNSVASKITALVSRVGGEERYIITGGVARNEGVVRAIGEHLGAELYVCPEAQICGAYGAALYAAGL
jgi:predicted CoA-substrate-specific enzyme activase